MGPGAVEAVLKGSRAACSRSSDVSPQPSGKNFGKSQSLSNLLMLVLTLNVSRGSLALSAVRSITGLEGFSVPLTLLEVISVSWKDDASCSLGRRASLFSSFPAAPTEVRKSFGVCHPRAGLKTTPYLTSDLSCSGYQPVVRQESHIQEDV